MEGLLYYAITAVVGFVAGKFGVKIPGLPSGPGPGGPPAPGPAPQPPPGPALSPAILALAELIQKLLDERLRKQQLAELRPVIEEVLGAR